jgi:predicted RNA binding protein YcfA (HicA-like mRNA interferase family)
MPKLPPTRPDDLVRIATKLGFVWDRQKGSHAVYLRQKDGRRVVIPMHKGDLKTGTLRGIVADMGISVEEFLRIR